MDKIKTISKEEFKQKLDSGDFILLDVRTQNEHNQEKIADSEVIDVYNLEAINKINSLDRNKKYLIYCRSGARSGQVLNIMRQMGFEEVYDLLGGILNWFSGNKKSA